MMSFPGKSLNQNSKNGIRKADSFTGKKPIPKYTKTTTSQKLPNASGMTKSNKTNVKPECGKPKTTNFMSNGHYCKPNTTNVIPENPSKTNLVNQYQGSLATLAT